MSSRREFFQNSLLSFGICPLLNKFHISNNDFLPRWDIVSKICENFILQIDRAIKSQAKSIDSIDIHWDNMIYDNKKVGIYGYCCSDNHIIVGTKIDWLKRYNVSTDLVIDSLCSYYMKNGYSRSEPIFGTNNYVSTKWGIRVYKGNK